MRDHDVQQLQRQVRKQTQEFPALKTENWNTLFLEILKNKYFPEGYIAWIPRNQNYEYVKGLSFGKPPVLVIIFVKFQCMYSFCSVSLFYSSKQMPVWNIAALVTCFNCNPGKKWKTTIELWKTHDQPDKQPRLQHWVYSVDINLLKQGFLKFVVWCFFFLGVTTVLI